MRVHPSPPRTRSLGIATLVLTVGYLGWRTGFTLNLDAPWISLPFLGIEVAGLISLTLFVFSVWNVDAVAPPLPRSETGHSLAVLIPTYNEEAEILLPTVAAALAVDLPHETWILDDGRRKWVEEMAAALGARYLSRPSNEHAKAGNLNHALDHVTADLIAVLDADHVPSPALFTDTVGYFDDPELALVQTPQSFYNTDSFEHVRDYEEEAMFYRVIQPGKNAHGAAFWCGTSAVLRTEALRSIGGVAVETLTEDLHTTLRLHRKRWRTVFHNEVLARGLAPTSYAAYALQRKRWATGAMQILRQDNPLFGAGLTTRQRLAYAATLSGWFEPLRTLAYFVVAIVVVVTGVSPIDAPLAVYAPLYGLVLVGQQTTLLSLSRGRHRLLPGLVFDWYRLSSGLHAVRRLLTPTGTSFLVTPKGRTGGERGRAPWPRALSVVAAAGLGSWAWFALTLAGRTPWHYQRLGPALIALAFLLFNLAVVIAGLVRATSEQYSAERRAGRRFRNRHVPIVLSNRNGRLRSPSITGAVIDLTGQGLLEGLLEQGRRISFAVDGPTALVPMHGTVKRGDDRSTAIEFVPGQWTALAQISLTIFAAPNNGSAVLALPPA